MYFPVYRNRNTRTIVNRNVDNLSNNYNLRSKGHVLDTDRVQNKPIEYKVRGSRSCNFMSFIIVVIVIIKIFCCC